MSLAFRASIVANIALTGVVAALLWRAQSESPPAAAPLVAPAFAQSQAQESGPTDSETLLESIGNKITPTAIAQFEQMGISREVLVNVVLGEFHRRWDTRFADLEARYAPKQVPEWEYVELGRLRDAEQLRELRETLGEARYLAWDKEQTLRMLNSGGLSMTPDEAERAYRLQKEYDEQRAELQMAMEDGLADMADVGVLQGQAQETLDRQLEELLGERRFKEMRGIADPIADVYRAFGDLNPTPVQAEAVVVAEGDYRAREIALTRRLGKGEKDAAAAAAELKAISDAREENLRQIFGAEAYDSMKRQADPTYKKLTQFAEAWELRDHEVQSVYETLHAFHDQAERARAAAAMSEAAGQPVDWREINAAIEQARNQTEADLQDLIGGERLSRLKQNELLTMR